MLDYTVAYIGESVYELLFWFFSYSIFGWIFESTYMSFCNKKLTNRGFVHGPICPIYGFGGTMVHFILRGFADNYIILYMAGALLATALEFLTAKLMSGTLGYVWWDYSNKPYNYKNIICLESTLAWGVCSVLEVAVFSKVVMCMMNTIPIIWGKRIVVALAVYYIIDMAYCLLRVKKGDVEADENNIMVVTK